MKMRPVSAVIGLRKKIGQSSMGSQMLPPMPQKSGRNTMLGGTQKVSDVIKGMTRHQSYAGFTNKIRPTSRYMRR